MARHAPPGQEAQAVTEQPACGHWNSPQARHCGGAPTRPYGIGHRRPRHTPATVAGRPEPPDGQGPFRHRTTTDNHAAPAAEKRTG
jgi:hypothetical protein